MTDKKLCGLRSVPSLFRLFANGVHCCPPKRRRDYKETALLFGRVAGCLTWSVNARSRHCSACLGYSPPDRLAGVRPPFRSSARSARSFLRFTPKTKAVFSRKKSVRGERTFFPKMAYLVFVPHPLHKNIIRKKVLYITRSYVTFFIPPPLATGNIT